ncbi:MAG: VCBS repeat-containing protein [Planctomycetota bacterium]|nr:VCBS repeat-containing protein [Planctomycetota bacterium]MDA0935030.1 VCBS repeat-containing protein [Planctomycetota bacterium]MDA1221398.1 VCBS repeat-containing protein [Planctomycetota bacterium]
MRRPLILASTLLPLAACADHSGGTGAASQTLSRILFETRTELAYDADGVEAAVVADFDRDGLVDMAAAAADGQLVLRFGQGGGTFATGRSIQAPVGLFRLFVEDVDADQDQDLVAVARDGTAVVFANDGFGNLTSNGTFPLGSGPLDVTAGDADGDGVVDLVVARNGAPDIQVFPGIGDGEFRSPTSLTFDRGAQVAGLSVGDLDGDSLPEIVACDLTRNRIAILPGSGSAPTYMTLGSVPAASVIGDLDADGAADFAVAHAGSRRIDLVRRGVAGNYEVSQSIATKGIPFSLCAGDLDGDGLQDLLSCEIDRRALCVHLGTGQGLDANGTALVTTGSPVSPMLADVDRDGRTDAFVPGFGGDRANLFLGSSSGLRGGRLHSVDGLVAPEIVQAADLITPGVQDLIVGELGSSTLVVHEVTAQVDADPILTPVAPLDLGRAVHNVIPVDLDKNQRTDLVVAVQGGIKLVRNIGPVANFRYGFQVEPAAGGVLAGGEGAFEVAAGDLDDDGLVDLVIAYIDDNTVSLLRGTGDGFSFAPAQSTPLSGRPVGLAIGDFDGDGRDEVAVSRLQRSTVDVLEVGENGLVPSTETPVGPGPTYLRAADFDGDGRTDLVVSETGRDTLSMLLSLPTGGFRVVSLDAGEAPTALATLDLNRDGFADILVASLVGADFRVLLGDGQGGVGDSLRFAGVYGALTAAVADLDGDLLPELSIGSLVSEGVAVFRNVSTRD